MALAADEILGTLILVMPGFVALSITRSTSAWPLKLEAFEMTIWSVFLSGIADLLLLILVQAPMPPTASGIVSTLGTSTGLAVYAALVLGIGIAGGLFLRMDGPDFFRKLVWIGAAHRYSPYNVWDSALSRYHKKWVIVEVGPSKTIQGWVERFSVGAEPRELFLAKPREVLFDDKGNPSYVPLSEGILLPGSEIRSIQFLPPNVDASGDETTHPRRVGPSRSRRTKPNA